MKPKKLVNRLSVGVWLAACVWLTSGCEQKEPVNNLFDQTPNARVEEARQALHQKLQSSEYGWKLVYFPRILDGASSSVQFTYLMDFMDAQQVQMEASNHGATRDTSEYDVALGSTLKFRFTTYNFIHELSDAGRSGIYGTGGRGAAGDFEFLYYGNDGDDLLLRTNRNTKEIRLEKANANSWGGNKEPLHDSLAKYFEHPDYRMRSYQGEELLGDSLVRIDLGQRHLSLFKVSGEVATQTSRSALGYGVNGVVVMPAIKIEDDEFYFFKWDKQERKLTSSLGDKRIEIVASQ